MDISSRKCFEVDQYQTKNPRHHYYEEIFVLNYFLSHQRVAQIGAGLGRLPSAAASEAHTFTLPDAFTSTS